MGTHGVQMKIGNQLQQIYIGFYQDGFVATLKKVTGLPSPPTDPTDVTKGEILHDA